MIIKNKKIVVVGLARSGITVAKYLANRGAIVTAIDKKKLVEIKHNKKDLLKLGINIKTGKQSLKDFRGAQLVILSPGVPKTLPFLKALAKKEIPIIGEIEFASKFIRKPIIGITGTNGKTTTSILTKRMLYYSSKKVFLGGNIGVPLTKCLYRINQTDVIVAEISSFQLDTIKDFHPTTSVLLNIAEDHMDRYSSFDDYANSKLKIFGNQTKKNVAIFNATDKITKDFVYSTNVKAQLRPFSNNLVKNGAQISKNSILIFSDHKLLCKFNLRKTSLKGYHNKENIAAASLAALSEGGTISGIQYAIDTVKPPKHRMESIGCFQKINFINDSKATNLHATITALKCFNSPVILILGGISKNKNLKFDLPKQVRLIIAIGEARHKIKLAISSELKGSNVVVYTTKTLKEAIKKAIKTASAGYTVLLSPACASFDQFKSYKQRGKKFKEFVKEILQKQLMVKN